MTETPPPDRPDASGRYAELRADHPALPELSLIHDFAVISDGDGLRVMVHLLPVSYFIGGDRKAPAPFAGPHSQPPVCSDCGLPVTGYRDYSLGLDGGMERIWLPCGHARFPS